MPGRQTSLSALPHLTCGFTFRLRLLCPYVPTIFTQGRCRPLPTMAEQGVDDGSAAGVLVAHQVPVGVPGLDRRRVAERDLEHLDPLTAWICAEAK